MLGVLLYVVVVGGTGSGELNPVLRAINAGIAAALIVAYVVRAPGRADSLDRGILAALVLFSSAGILSLFPRQSFDSVLAAMAYVAGLFLAREYLAYDSVRATLIRVLIGLSIVFTVGASAAWIPEFFRWWSLAGWTAAPRLDLPLSGGPWGYRYDVALLIALLYPAWWIGRPSVPRRLAALVIGLLGLVVIVITGSRTVWLAVVIASVAWGALAAVRGIKRHRQARWSAFVALIMGIGLAASGLLSALAERAFTLESLSARITMWSPLTNLWLSHPIAGVGPGSFPWTLRMTPYFDTTTWAPRHPDSALFQLLPEAGLLGIAALSLVIAVAVPRVVRGRSTAARWAVIVFAVACLGANPTDFAFLVVLLLAWVAYAAPHEPPAIRRWSAERSMPMLVASTAVMAIIFVAHASTLAGGFAYAAAQTSVERGKLPDAQVALDLAVSLDPGMALYWRQRGIAWHLLGDPHRALQDLGIATEINPVDDLAWRATALSHLAAGHSQAAANAAETATVVQRSDVANLLVAAWLADREGRDAEAMSIFAEVVQAYPAITGAVGWSNVVPSEGTGDVLDEAAARWARRTPSFEPRGSQELWLAALRDDPRPPPRGTTSPQLARAMTAALRCAEDADDLLRQVTASDHRTAAYWATRVRAAANAGIVDHDALLALYAITGTPAPAQLAERTTNPLNEGNWWGYRRFPIFWPPSILQLPDPHAGVIRWMRFPSDAVEEAGLQAQLPGC